MDVDAADRVRDNDDFEAVGERVDHGAPDAVVGGEAADVKPIDAALTQ